MAFTSRLTFCVILFLDALPAKLKQPFLNLINFDKCLINGSVAFLTLILDILVLLYENNHLLLGFRELAALFDSLVILIEPIYDFVNGRNNELMRNLKRIFFSVDVLVALIQFVLEAVCDLVVPLQVLDLKVCVEVVQVVPFILKIVV